MVNKRLFTIFYCIIIKYKKEFSMLVKVETVNISYRGANVIVTKNDPSEMYINTKKIISAVPVDLPTNQRL